MGSAQAPGAPAPGGLCPGVRTFWSDGSGPRSPRFWSGQSQCVRLLEGWPSVHPSVLQRLASVRLPSGEVSPRAPHLLEGSALGARLLRPGHGAGASRGGRTDTSLELDALLRAGRKPCLGSLHLIPVSRGRGVYRGAPLPPALVPGSRVTLAELPKPTV